MAPAIHSGGSSVKQRLLPLLLASCLVVLGACTEDDDPGTKGGGQKPPAATDETSSPPATPSAPTSPTSTVEPASGVRLELDAISANAPKGWTKDRLATSNQISATHPEVVTVLFLFQVPDPSLGAGGLERAAQQSLRIGGYLQKPKILEPTEIDGVEMYHIAGRIDRATFIEEFGATVDGQLVRVKLVMAEVMSKKERRELVESVLQTVQIGG